MTSTLDPGVTRFRPLLKWPGGKGREWDEIAPLLPAGIRDFVDPFMGGGAPFAGTPFAGRAHLNDRHARLVDLHRRVQAQDAEFLASVDALGTTWDALTGVATRVADVFAALVDEHREGRRPDRAPPAASIRATAVSAVSETDADAIAASVLDKAGRLARLEGRHDVRFGADEIVVHCETAVRAGFYTAVRARERTSTGAAGAADFLFVREYCYGAMFRHNADGAFNIPYGGTSYNRKSLLARAAQYRAPETLAALGRATFASEDFAPFLARLRPSMTRADLVFADPPYDSDFKSYGPDAFTHADHRRLASALAALPCRWMLVIKETDFVREAYLRPEMRAHGAREVHAFGKRYGYNVRGRNERATRHLVVTNYDASVLAGGALRSPPLSPRSPPA